MEDLIMKRKITIEGMSCMHCVMHVKEALEEIGAKNVEVNLETGIAFAETEKSETEIRAAIEDAGYDVKSIE